jgi:hypothetical protein
MIATLSEIKTILGYTDTSHDAQIVSLIPMVEDDIITECNNTFIHSTIYFAGDIVSTVAGAVYSFDCADGSMDDAELDVGDIIYARGSARNDGYYTITAIADTKITVREPLKAHAEESFTLYLVDIPVGLKIYIAKMVAWQINHASDSGLTGESIGNYSYSRSAGSSSDAGYPAEILRGLAKWKRVTTKMGSIQTHFRDYRGFSSALRDVNDDI